LAARLARKDSLSRFLENRPQEQDLVEKNILHNYDESSKQEDRKDTAVKLGRKLSMRPTQEELEQRNILHGE